MGAGRSIGAWALVLTSLATGGTPARAETATSTGAPSRAEYDALQAELDVMRAEFDDALLAAPELPGADGAGFDLSFYGFFETGAQRTWGDEGGLTTGVQQTPASSFILGNLHLYLDARPSPNWRALFELRLTVSQGALGIGSGGIAILDTTERRINDPGIGSGGTQLTASVILERAQVEWQYNDAFGLRFGLWLTPWGIWNVDHGAPTLIPLILPYFISLDFFPTRQLGVVAFGALRLDDWKLEYSAGLSNGRLVGPATRRGLTWSSFDLTDDKMLSGRLVLASTGPRELRLGLSAYWGTTAEDDRQVTQLAPVRVTNGTGVEMQEWGFGADISWDVWHLRLRAEAYYNRFRYPGERPLSAFFPSEFEPDSHQLGGYLLLSYPTELFGIPIEPYLYSEHSYFPSTVPPFDIGALASAGVNFAFTPSIQVKAQYGLQYFLALEDGGVRYGDRDELHLLSARLVVSF